MSVNDSTTQTGVEILIAEDSPTQALHLQYLLEERGYMVTPTVNGSAALAAARKRKPAMLISDVMMPEMNGYQLCKAIKSDEALKDILVILVTSLSSPQDVISGLECGADSFIRKPYDEKYLLSRVDYLRANQALREQERSRTSLEVYLGGQKYLIASERQQILDLLISTYDEAIRLHDGLEQSHQRLSGLYRIADALNRANTVAGVCEAALTHTLELPDLSMGWIFIKDQDSNGYLAASQGFVPPSSITNCDCFRNLVAGNLGQSDRVVECEFSSGGDGPLLHTSVALWNGDQVLGVMNLVGSEGWQLDADNRHALESLGNQIGAALERAQLHENLERIVDVRTQALTSEIAERARIETQLRQTLVKLDANNRELQDFAYVASHDLQEPLRKIQAFGDRLTAQAGTGLDDKSRDYLERMQSAAARMQTLISDLLSFSRVTTQAAPFNPVDLNDVLKGVISDLQIRIEESNGHIEAGPLPTIDADAVQMRQLLQNLLSNALKFHKQGVAPLVKVTAEIKGELCEISVADNGIGFDEKYLDRIFTIFQRLHGRSEYEGTGIGLSVVRKIADRHGGSATAYSTLGEGSTFVITLPVKHDPPAMVR